MIVLSIIEKNPKISRPTHKDQEIDDVRAVLKQPKEAGWVGQLASELTTHMPPVPPPGAGPLIIQIVGHGAPGQLSVGGTYEDRYQAFPPETVRHFYLDSNPVGYGVLFEKIPKEAEVWLVGCSVGEDPAISYKCVATGRTLLFDLAQMWGCRVRASTGLVSDKDFTNGLFNRPNDLATAEPIPKSTPPGPHPPLPVPASEWEWRVSRARRPPRLPEGAEVTQRLVLQRLVKAPLLGGSMGAFKPVDVADVPSAGLTLGNGFKFELTPGLGRILAAPELTFSARWKGVPGDAHLLLNSRLLRFHPGGDPDVFHDFVANPAQESGINSVLTTLLGTGLPRPLA